MFWRQFILLICLAVFIAVILVIAGTLQHFIYTLIKNDNETAKVLIQLGVALLIGAVVITFLFALYGDESFLENFLIAAASDS